MSTANDIITRAFTRAGIRTAETSLEPDEIEDGLAMLNDMLSAWEPTHQLGFSPVSDVSDEVRIPRFANAAVIDSLAIMLSPEYSRTVSPALAASARSNMGMMMRATIDLSNVDMPSTLPLGSGNQCDNGGDGDDRRFFSEKDKVNF